MSGARRVLGAALTLACSFGAAPAVNADEPDPVRILILGDSVTQGTAGDYTWRYWAWRSLLDAGVDVDLVGPSTDLYDNVNELRGDSTYDALVDADPEHPFDRDHAARWGLPLAAPDVAIADLVAQHHPDVIVETRGINDLTWFARGAVAVAGTLHDEIEAARAVDPEVDFVVGQLPQTWMDAPGRWTHGAEVAAYNQALLDTIDPLDAGRSEVVVAHTGSGFVQGLADRDDPDYVAPDLVDTLDPAHLTARGEVKLAAGVVDALADLGIGTGFQRPLPEVANGHWGTAELTALPADLGAELTWVRPPGGRAEYVWMRDLTAAQPWLRLPFPLEGTSWLAGGLSAGHRYEFRLQALKGVVPADAFSNVVEVTPTVPEEPPTPPAAPANLVIIPGVQQLAVAWDAVATATSYDVTWSEPDGGSGRVSVVEPSAVLTGLRPGSTYTVSVVARNEALFGPPTSTTGVPMVPPPPPVPAAPTGLQVTRGLHQLRVSWDPGPAGTTYDVELVGDAPGGRARLATEQSPVVFRGLLAGARYTALVTPSNPAGAGPAVQATGRPTGPRVSGPAGLRARAAGANRVRLTWRPRRQATTYEVAMWRDRRWVVVRATAGTGAWVRIPSGPARLRVRSWHQRLAGGWSAVARLRVR